MRKLVLSAAAFVVTSGVLAQAPATPSPAKPRLALTTTAFEDGGIVPVKYSQAAEGGAISPNLTWSGVPDGTVSFTVVVTDPDTAPGKSINEVLHWMMFNIPGTARELPDGVPAQAQLPDGSIQLPNQSKKIGYLGMGAPGPGPYHHYTWSIYALDTKLTLGPDATQTDVMKAMDGHILMKGVLVGRFHRP